MSMTKPNPLGRQCITMLDLRKTFRSDPTPYVLMFRSLMIALGLLIVTATVVGQLNAGRFPAYSDLAIAAIIPFVAFGAIAALMYGAAALFPIRIGPAGLKCYNMMGMYRLAPWAEIQTAEVRDISGVPYIFITTARNKGPITVPVWLKDFSGFALAVKEYAGASNPLTQLLDEK